METEGIYLDNNATTPVDPRVFEALTPYLKDSVPAGIQASTVFEHRSGYRVSLAHLGWHLCWVMFAERFANPSSKHALGRVAASAVSEARKCVAQTLGSLPECITFTSGATESINWALRSAARLRRLAGPRVGRIVTCALEHPSVLRVCEALRDEEGFELKLCPVTPHGLVDVVALKALLTPETVVISIPVANGEVGVVQPLQEAVSLARHQCPNALIHADASQALGKVSVHAVSLGVDLLTVAGHKVYAPKGIGALYIREGLEFHALLLGGGQESGLRGGTENVAFIVALAKACQLIMESWDAPEKRYSEREVATGVAALLTGANGVKTSHEPSETVPHPSNLGFTAKVFVEAFWGALEKESGLSRQQRQAESIRLASTFCSAMTGDDIVCFPAPDAVSTSIRFNGPLGSEDPTVQMQWLPGTLHLSVKGADGMQMACDLAEKEKLFLSAGVSCHQGKVASGTLVAMGHSDDWAMGSLRISVGRQTSASEAVCGALKLAKYLVAHGMIRPGSPAD